MKGILLAGGTGSRLCLLTHVVSKQLMPVYDKPMIYYPLSVRMLAGIREILVISTPHALPLFWKFLGDGSQWGLSLSYKVQSRPDGLAQAFILGKDFIDNQPVCLALGDNLLYGNGLVETLQKAAQLQQGGLIFGCRVNDPSAYGVVEFDHTGHVVGIEEKPKIPKSKFAVPGIYFYDDQAADIAASIKPSPRGELEITDLNKVYLEQGLLPVELLGRSYAWLDTGTHDSLLQASEFIQSLEKRQGFKVACLEEIAYRLGFIDAEQLYNLSQLLLKSEYGNYLLQLLEDDNPINRPIGAALHPRSIDSEFLNYSLAY